ncbi:MAG: glycosyltransferase family 4 protein [Steroidobacteraceae bacterium]
MSDQMTFDIRPKSYPVAKRVVHMLIVSADTYPATRVDVTVLFGEQLAGRGHKIDWLLQSEQRCDKSYATGWGNGTVWVGATDLGDSLFHRVRKHLLGIAHDLSLFSTLRSGNYDLIEVKDKFISGVFAAIAARWYGKRFVYWLSYPFPEEYLYRAQDPAERYARLYRIRGLVFKFILYKLLLPGADHVFVQSEQMRRDIAAEGIPIDKMTAVPMGIRSDKITNAFAGQQRSVIPFGERCFLYLGTLAKVRRMDFLIRVLADVHKQAPDVKLYLVGKGNHPSDEQILVDEAKRLNVLSSVVFVGQLPQSEALRYVQDADVCVSPFFPTPVLNSTSPTKLVEYMAMGKAVVANDHPEQRLVIEQSGGGYCVPYQEDAFSAAIVKLLNAPDTARAMGERGRQYVLEHRSYEKIADTVEDALLRIIAEPQR